LTPFNYRQDFYIYRTDDIGTPTDESKQIDYILQYRASGKIDDPVTALVDESTGHPVTIGDLRAKIVYQLDIAVTINLDESGLIDYVFSYKDGVAYIDGATETYQPTAHLAQNILSNTTGNEDKIDYVIEYNVKDDIDDMTLDNNNIITYIKYDLGDSRMRGYYIPIY